MRKPQENVITQAPESISITELIHAWGSGDSQAREQCFTLLYPNLKQIAIRERSIESAECTLQATELVHEAYLRLSQSTLPTIQDRRHFLAMATGVIRRILVDRARARRAAKRGRGQPQLPIPRSHHWDPDLELLELDRGLKQLEQLDPDASLIVGLRYFGGLTVEETADALGLGRATVVRRWRWARAWLRSVLRHTDQVT